MAGPEDIEKFWAWFAEADERLDAALRDPEGRGTAIDEVRFRVGKVRLAGDLLTAPDGRHLIIGSAANDRDFRLVAAHWLLAAPQDHPRFAFATHHPAEPIDRLMASTLSGKPPVRIADLRFTARWRRTADRADITVWVPPDHTDAHAKRVASTVLHSALGELEADAWLGETKLVSKEPVGAVDLAALLGQLAPEIEARTEPRWEKYRYEKQGAPTLTVQIRQPLQPERHPFLDTCIEIATLLINDDPEEPGRMREQLMDDIPTDVLLAGAILSAGRQNLLLYANGRSPTIDVLRERAAMLGSEIRAAYDPDWARIKRYQQIDPAAG
ncbi:MAG: hypothetical protein J7513_02575 [Solirubrobacteraceae bacterium]|nr:hypothetical protein [Solirubrobacteraceae bacterium]